MSFLSSIPIWGWCDIFFNVTVLLALCGESHWALKYLIANNSLGKTSAKWRREKLKKKFEFLLIVGIAGEVGCIPFSLYEASSANREAGIAMLDAANSASNSVVLSLRVEELRHKNDEFAEQQLPMPIDQQSLLMELGGGLVNARTIITNSIIDANARATAYDLAFALKSAGTEVLGNFSDPFNDPTLEPIRGIVIKFNANPTNIDDGVAESACFLFKALINNGLPAQFRPLSNSTDIPQGTIVVDVLQRPNPVAYKRILLTSKLFKVKTEIGLNGPQLQRAMGLFESNNKKVIDAE